MAAPTRRGAATTSAWNTSTTPKTVALSGLFTGDLLGLFVVDEDGLNSVNSGPTTTVGATSAWTSVKNVGTSTVSTRVQLFTATVTADGSVTVSVGMSQTAPAPRWGCYMFAYAVGATFGDVGSKDPTASGGSSIAMDTGASTNYTLDSLTTTADNAAIEFIVGDWTANATNPTAGERRETDAGTMTYITHYQGDGTNYGVHGGYYPDSGAAGTKVVGFSTLRKPTIVAIEIQGPAGGAAAPVFRPHRMPLGA